MKKNKNNYFIGVKIFIHESQSIIRLDIEKGASILKEVIYWQRIYRMQNGKSFATIHFIEIFDCGKLSLADDKLINKINLISRILKFIPKIILKRKKRIFGF